jgi:hypothetical protein
MLGTPGNLGLGIARSLGDKRYTYPKNSLWIFKGIICWDCWEFVPELGGSLMWERNHDNHKSDVQRDLIHQIIWCCWESFSLTCLVGLVQLLWKHWVKHLYVHHAIDSMCTLTMVVCSTLWINWHLYNSEICGNYTALLFCYIVSNFCPHFFPTYHNSKPQRNFLGCFCPQRTNFKSM